MAALCRWILVLGLLLPLQAGIGVAATNETGAFTSAEESFRDTFYIRAEAEFGAFVQQYTNSTRLPEAILYQAKARLQLTNYSGAIELLSNSLPQAGKLGDEYVFWLAQANLRSGDKRKAADHFAELVNRFTNSTRRLEAVVSEATVRSGMGEWGRVMELLQQTNGVFQTIVRAEGATNEFSARGYLLLSEALLSKRDFAGAEQALQPIRATQLSPALAWRRQYMLCRAKLGQNQLDAALAGITNLLALGTNASQPYLQADGVALYAGLLERLGRTDEAVETYQRNLTEGVPTERQRQALLKITELSLAQNKIPRAAQMLEKYCQQHRDAGSRDLALLTLGELRLRQFALEGAKTNAASVTNFLEPAMSALQTLVKEFAQSELLGKAHLDLGWCYWIQENLPEAKQSFAQAVPRLLDPSDKATAHFKLADTQYRLKEFEGAVTNYNAVIEASATLPEVKQTLMEPALYQLVRAGLAAGNISAATNGLTAILQSFPTGYNTERAVLLTGQQIARDGDPAKAREIFLEFVRTAMDSPLMPQVQMAIANTFERQEQWEEVINVYDAWLSRYTNSPLRADAEYGRAWASFQGGHETNAFNYFTNFLGQYPGHERLPLAQWWVADYYFRNGRLKDAEENYQLLYHSTNWPKSTLSYEALLMAGRTAVDRYAWTDAIAYFTNLTSDLRCPPEVWVRAMFAYGDVLMSIDSTNKLADYEQAITVFSTITDSYPTNKIAVLAMGQKANCLLQWALFTQQYEPALREYAKLTNSPLADAAVRSIARVGIGTVLEKQALQKTGAEQAALLHAALNQYLDVLYFEKDLREGEEPDLYWVKRAGLEAARLVETTGEWSQAIKVYERLRDLLPALRPSLEKRLGRATEQLVKSRL